MECDISKMIRKLPAKRQQLMTTIFNKIHQFQQHQSLYACCEWFESNRGGMPTGGIIIWWYTYTMFYPDCVANAGHIKLWKPSWIIHQAGAEWDECIDIVVDASHAHISHTGALAYAHISQMCCRNADVSSSLSSTVDITNTHTYTSHCARSDTIL